ncbi:MAG: DUF4351 domain-containing protein [Leptolyngbyaceae cyanobacterium bins.59]|nr:DUF4351 domain-containing protein [Leptolyngbyaceae cyanobacterium bins.59]
MKQKYLELHLSWAREGEGGIYPSLVLMISTLSFEQLDEVGIALPGFTSEADLRNWLQSRHLC